MSTKPATSQSCNTHACVEAPACGCTGTYPSEHSHGWYYKYIDEGYYEGHWMEYLVFNGARIPAGGGFNDVGMRSVSKNDVFCNDTGTGTPAGSWSACSPCDASIRPIVYGAYEYTAYGCCGGCKWNNGVSWFWYGVMNVKRRPI